MNDKDKRRIQLECLYEMFRDRVEENVVYIVFTENEGKIDATIDQLMSIAKCSFTGYDFDTTQNTYLSDNLAKNGLTIEPRSKSRSCTRAEKQRKIQQQEQKKTSINQGDLGNLPDNGNDEEENINDDKDDDELTLDEKITKLQKSIEGISEEKRSCHDKASQYLNKRMFPVTSYYSDLANQYRRLIENKTKKLVELLILKSKNSNTIDLHGLNPIQAKLVVNELLNIRQDKLSIDKQGETSIDIITGWGKHTVTSNHHRIRPTIVALLREKGFEYYHLNKGALRVTIRR